MKNLSLKQIITWSISILIIAIVLLWMFIPKATKVEIVTIKSAPFTQSIEEDGKTRAKDVFIVFVITNQMFSTRLLN